MAIGMGLLKDREVLIDSARLLSIVVSWNVALAAHCFSLSGL